MENQVSGDAQIGSFKKPSTSRFSNWGFIIGGMSLVLLLSYFLMFFGMMLSPIGLIFSVINFVNGVRQSNSREISKEVVFSILGFLFSGYVLASAIYYLLYHPALG